MSITSEIQRIQGNISDAYNACATKNATMPAVQDSAYLADAINSITGGGGGTEGYDFGVGKYWVDNGVAMSQTSDVSNAFKSIISIQDYAMSDACKNMSITGEVNFCNLTSVGQNGLTNTFQNCKYITNVVFSNITSITANNALNSTFDNCSNISYANFYNLVSVSGRHAMTWAFAGNSAQHIYMPKLEEVGQASMYAMTRGSNRILSFYAPALMSVGFSGLQGAFSEDNFVNFYAPNISNIGNAAFQGAFYGSKINTFSFPRIETAPINAFNGCCSYCNDLSNIYLPNLTRADANSFVVFCSNCPNITSVDFPSLTWINHYAFRLAFINCVQLGNIYFNALTSSSFGSYQDQFYNMLQGVTGATVHFPAAIQETIGTWSDVTSGFGGTSTTVLFDL